MYSSQMLTVLLFPNIKCGGILASKKLNLKNTKRLVALITKETKRAHNSSTSWGPQDRAFFL